MKALKIIITRKQLEGKHIFYQHRRSSMILTEDDTYDE